MNHLLQKTLFRFPEQSLGRMWNKSPILIPIIKAIHIRITGPKCYCASLKHTFPLCEWSLKRSSYLPFAQEEAKRQRKLLKKSI